MDLQQLTKKNQEFIHIATHQLIKDGKTDAEIKDILSQVLPAILENQHKGIPARALLGAPTAWAHSFTEPKVQPAQAKTEKNTNPWLMWLDSSLFFTAIVFLLNGVMPLFGSTSDTSGIISILTLGFSGGAVVYAVYHFIYRYLGTKERPSLPKTVLILLAVFAVWVLVYGMTALLPVSINATLHFGVYLVLSGLFFLARFYLQAKYNIQNAMAPAKR